MSHASALITVMINAAHKAARAINRDFGEAQALQVSRKGIADFVSQADHKAEQAIFEALSLGRPKYGFVMEERGEIEGSDNSNRWIVDPIDGTTNFLHGLPHFAISIALERDRQPYAGVVYNPVLDQLYVAERGKGATVNGKRLRISDLSEMRGAMAYYDQGYGVDRRAGLYHYTSIARATRRCLHLWSPALDWCNIAHGRAHLIVAHDAEIEDKLAGVLILQEAGGVVTDWAGRAPNLNILKHRTTSLIGFVPGLRDTALQLIQSLLATRNQI